MEKSEAESKIRQCADRWNYILEGAPDKSTIMTSFKPPFVLWRVRLVKENLFALGQVEFTEERWTELNDLIARGELDPLGKLPEPNEHIEVVGYCRRSRYGKDEWCIMINAPGVKEKPGVIIEHE